MNQPLTPTELLGLIADGLDDTVFDRASGAPVVLIDLAEDHSSQDLRRVTQRMSTVPLVVIGVAREAAVDSDASGFDLLVCSDETAPAPWVACGDSLDTVVGDLVASIASSPDASVALAQLLRAAESATPADAVVAESWVYSLLQTGPVHCRWLESNDSRTRRPRPERAVLVERRGEVLAVTLDRPEVHNAYGAKMRDELVDALRMVSVDESIAHVVLRGNGPSFCSGGDLDEFGTTPSAVEAHDIRIRRNAGIALAAVADRVEARVHGTCVGAGVELPAFASVVVADPETTFQLPEISMGLVPGAGGTSSIPRRTGRHRAAFLALSGRPIDAATARDWGLIDRIEPGGGDV